MKLLGRTVAVEHLKQDAPKSGLVIPDIAKDSHVTGNVKARVTNIGSQSEYKNELLVGNIVLVPFHLGTRRTIEGKNVIIYDDEDILCQLL